jgi:putative DNA primase/helicase
MSGPEIYINAAFKNEIAHRAAFKLGTIPGMTTDTAINALLLGAGSSGHAAERGEQVTRKVIKSGLENGHPTPTVIDAATSHSSRPVAIIDKRAAAAPTNSGAELESVDALAVSNASPTRSVPDEMGEPEFYEPAEEGPSVRSEEIRLQVSEVDGPFSADTSMSRDHSALTADPGSDQPMASAFPEPLEMVVTASADAGMPERNDERLYGRHAAEILRDCRRDVALAPSGAKTIAFQDVAKKLGQAVTDQWLPKAAAVDRLLEIAEAHGSFGLNSEELQQLISAAAVEVRMPKTPPASVPPKRRLISHRASDVQPERLEWVWPGRIARGKAALLGGPPGLGKSQVTANIAATVSTGGRWPCKEGDAPQGDVVILSAEDGMADTIVPRLIAAGADTNCVHIVAAATKLDGTGRKTFSLKTDVDLLEELSREIGTVRLIIIDPISAYMGGADGNGNVETREVLEPLAEMANRLGIAVVAVTHLNKGGAGGQSALNRFAGSIAFVAAARSAYLIIEDSDDENRRLFLQAKNNLGPKGKGLAFRVEQRLIPGDILASNISWDTDHVTASVDEALIASETRSGGESRSGKDEAADFLRSVLSNGPVAVADIEAEARAAGLLGKESPIGQNKTFRDARKELGVVSSRDGFGPGARYVLGLADSPWMPKNSMDAPLEKRAPMANLGIHGDSETSS